MNACWAKLRSQHEDEIWQFQRISAFEIISLGVKMNLYEQMLHIEQ